MAKRAEKLKKKKSSEKIMSLGINNLGPLKNNFLLIYIIILGFFNIILKWTRYHENGKIQPS